MATHVCAFERCQAPVATQQLSPRQARALQSEFCTAWQAGKQKVLPSKLKNVSP